MKLLQDCPKVLFRKVILTLVVGIGCLLVGGAYFLFSGDRTTLMLSAIILVFSTGRTLSLYRSVIAGSYEVVEGTVVAVKARPLRKHSIVKVMDDDGLETSLRLGKQAKVKIGYRYRFYFTKVPALSLGSEYLDAALSHGGFLGYECLGDIMDTPAPEEQAPAGEDNSQE